MTEQLQLLTDEQMRTFLAQGYLILQTDFSDAFHERLLGQLNEVYGKEGNPGNNLLPRIRELRQVFDHKVVRGALTSVLGPNYMLHAHRHGHFNNSPKPGGWHKDSYWGYYYTRHLRPWWAMIMYFPQDTPLELGPTGVMPGTQFYESRTFAGDEHAAEAKASGKAGTFALIHYDIWHRSTANTAGKERYMLKFEFMRTELPTAPSWDNREREWRMPASLDPSVLRHEAIWRESWNWLQGRGGVAEAADGSAARAGELALLLAGEDEPAALDAAYELASLGEPGREALLAALRGEAKQASRCAAYGLAAAGPQAVPGLVAALGAEREETAVHAAFALGEHGDAATAAAGALGAKLSDASAAVRCAAVEALGCIGAGGTADAAHVAALAGALGDENAQVRFTAGLALCKLGAAADAAVPALIRAMEDDNRYVRAHAAEALYYIGTEQAKDALLEFLRNARWCPSTTPASTFYP